MRFVLASGDFVSTGGRAGKNVAGYELWTLMIGSVETLGVVVEASFEVYPLPVDERVGTISLPDPGSRSPSHETRGFQSASRYWWYQGQRTAGG